MNHGVTGKEAGWDHTDSFELVYKLQRTLAKVVGVALCSAGLYNKVVVVRYRRYLS